MTSTADFDPYRRLEELGLALTAPGPSVDWFLKAFAVGDQLHVSGQLATGPDGELVAHGYLGSEVSLEEGAGAAQQAMLNVLSYVHDTTGDLRLWRPAKITVYGAVSPDFTRLGTVATGASMLLVKVFGPHFGAHARTAVSMPMTANGSPVEVEAIFARR